MGGIVFIANVRKVLFLLAKVRKIAVEKGKKTLYIMFFYKL